MRLRSLLLVTALAATGACSDDGAIWTTATTPVTATTGAPSTAAPTTTLPSTTTGATAGTTTSVPADLGGVGDPYWPELGNAGYDVEHYFIDLAVDPVANTLAGSVEITAAAEMNLDRFHLDFLGLVVDGVAVDDGEAAFSREGGELIVEPTAVLPAGESFTVAVAYHGTPTSTYTLGFPAGWIHTGDLVYVVAEPDGARTWFPANDHPRDKASFTFRITVPAGNIVAANGTLAGVQEGDGETTFTWDMQAPMATYLATIVAGDLVRVEGGSPAGVFLRDYLPADLAADPPAVLGRAGEMIEFFSDLFGPFPFSEYGHAIVPGLPGALEDQTLCIFGREALEDYFTVQPGVDAVVAHELAHQWFGDSVTPATWRDIWLNEGFATFAQWLWVEHDRGAAAYRAEVSGSYAFVAESPHPVPGDPGPSGEEMFHYSVYLRGGLTLHALRTAVGDEATFRILREWADRYSYGNATTGDFVSLAEEVSGQDLDALFDAWLFSPAIPALPG